MIKNIFAAAMLVVSGTASAGLVTHEFNNGDDLSAWQRDRTMPSGFEIVNNELVMTIEGDDAPNVNGVFYDTHGMKLDIGQSTFLSIDMYVEQDWNFNDIYNRYAGIWAVGYDSSDAIVNYAILEYQDGGFSAYDSGFDSPNGGWPVNDLNFNFGLNTLSFGLNGSGVDYYLNGALVYSETTSGTTYFGDVILNAKNESHDFQVTYDNLTYGTVPEPGMLALFGLGALLLLRRKRV